MSMTTCCLGVTRDVNRMISIGLGSHIQHRLDASARSDFNATIRRKDDGVCVGHRTSRIFRRFTQRPAKHDSRSFVGIVTHRAVGR